MTTTSEMKSLEKGLARLNMDSYRKKPRGFKVSSSPTPYKKKYRWHDDSGKELTAGGLLPYDEEGFWVIGEINKDTITYTDMGGKYEFADCDIFATIAREVSEETYYSCELTRELMVKLSSKYTGVYVNGHQSKPVYVCYIVPLFELPFIPDQDSFSARRQETIRGNPYVPIHCYNSVCILHIKWEEVEKLYKSFSYRLKRILKFGNLRHRLEAVFENRSPSPEPAPIEAQSDDEQ